jgi:hypothetical protein
MKTIATILFILTLLPTQTKKWYEGGTLHKLYISDWKKASEVNRLATCADFIAATQKITDMTKLKAKSIELKNCITEATKGDAGVDREKVSTIAALCTQLLEAK